MFKTTLALCLALALALAEAASQDVAAFHSSTEGADNYIKLHQRHYKNIRDNYDTAMQIFANHYQGRLDEINVQLEMVTSSIARTDKRLNALEILSNFHKQCVVEHRPQVEFARNSIGSCVATALGVFNDFLVGARKVRNDWEEYYTNYFDNEIKNCGIQGVNATESYEPCLFAATAKSEAYINDNRKEFEYELEQADCAAKAAIKTAIDCNYGIQQSTIRNLARANLLVDNCVEGKGQCQPCKYYCNDLLVLPDYVLQAKTMHNPLYLRPDNPKCYLIANEKVYKHWLPQFEQ